jgi:hypothetical protein
MAKDKSTAKSDALRKQREEQWLASEKQAAEREKKQSPIKRSARRTNEGVTSRTPTPDLEVDPTIGDGSATSGTAPDES